MIKTAQIIRRFAFEEWSGTENSIWNSVLGMRKHNVESEILCTTALAPLEMEERSGIAIRRFPYQYPYWPLSDEDRHRLDRRFGNPVSMSLYRFLKTSDYDLLHVHSAGRIAGLVRAAARKRKIPYVVSFQRGYLQIPEQERLELESPLRHTVSYGRLIELTHAWRRNFIKDASGVVCVGKEDADFLRHRWPNKRILRLPDGVDFERFSTPVKTDVRKAFGIPPYRTLLLCVSRIDEQKNQKLLVRFVSTLTEEGENVHALIIGPPSTDYYLKELHELARELQVEDRITIVPGLGANDERLVAAYQDSDVFIMPSRDETFGIVVLEAWSAGLPVIASAVGGLTQLIRDGENGLLFESD
ncbi:MAG: glycosyltransferase family 4 protein, partial [Victivallales bacterium]|nr:glycosyltransferase family 4 protein [Victivallales bacterium]